jgi:hypothetical protein
MSALIVSGPDGDLVPEESYGGGEEQAQGKKTGRIANSNLLRSFTERKRIRHLNLPAYFFGFFERFTVKLSMSPAILTYTIFDFSVRY